MRPALPRLKKLPQIEDADRWAVQLRPGEEAYTVRVKIDYGREAYWANLAGAIKRLQWTRGLA